ncbi:MAG: BON domain-containing protein [Endomicrobiales bacterium]
MATTAKEISPEQRLKDNILKHLAAFEFVPENDIHVSVSGSTVTLHGLVGTELERQRTEKMVKGLPGVSDVRNRLQVQALQKKVIRGY